VSRQGLGVADRDALIRDIAAEVVALASGLLESPDDDHFERVRNRRLNEAKSDEERDLLRGITWEEVHAQIDYEDA
jgi:hypothetical protein